MLDSRGEKIEYIGQGGDKYERKIPFQQQEIDHSKKFREWRERLTSTRR